ncbi:MAG: hypothetical protein N3D15_05905 [Syntrophorhabdaceae bacterium]|nr:hypothetical protein [Syntrophorhabdaceae bacterium]
MRIKNLICLIFFIIITGIGGIFAQIVLLREMLILFSGNELSIGVIIGSWVLWEAGGAYIAGRLQIAGRTAVKALVFSTLLFSFLFPLSIYASRIFKIIAGIPPETGTGLLPIFYASFFIIFPVGFLHGMLFTMLCSFYNEITEGHRSSIGRVYFYEMLGTIIGGVLLNYIFIQFFNSFTIAAGLGVVSALMCIILVYFIPDIKKFLLIAISSIFLFITLIMVAGGIADYIHGVSITKQWSSRKIVYYKNSPYQNIVVTSDDGQFTFFADGIPVITTPNPDTAYTEDFVHFTMLSHPMPENILVLSGGAGGVIHEILKYKSVKKIDYVELDPVFLETIQMFPTAITKGELKNPVVNLHFLDGRMFVKNSPVMYDVVFLGVPPPHTLQTNRFFTEEFFNIVKNILKPHGLVSFTLPATMTYYTNELRDIHTCIIKTLGQVFRYRYIVPGDFNIFIFTNSDTFKKNNTSVISERFKVSGVVTNLINNFYIMERLDERKKEWYLSNIKGSYADINRDFSPYAFFYTIAYNNLIYSPYLKVFFDTLKGMNLFKVMLFFLLVSLFFFILSLKQKNLSIVYVIGTTGLASMVLELILILSFQTFYGYVFFEVGVLVMVFLSGIAFGGIGVSTGYMRRFRDIRMLQSVEIAMIVLICVVFFILRYFCPQIQSMPFLIKAIFFILLFISGLFTGAEFPLSSRIYAGSAGIKNNIGRTVGLLYSVDLLGGFIGGLLGGIMLSVIGILEGCITLAVLKICSVLILLRYRDFKSPHISANP